ncbi:OmpA family protein [Cupriavidus basilensis]|uniref:OmpA family protein n=1 Tax=Cupriavidus basilensis TaxID=68895 RepID=A0ABT6API3_9BURK|nr:OmpA family protein [Cupriavidus basilensis]MDF3834517.1 OmpA family protein [Cupriavidus basilensis]
MKKSMKRVTGLCAGTALLMLQACGTMYVGERANKDGEAGEVVFPAVERDAWIKEGTFPNLDNLRQVAPGVTKPQLYALLGHPHFGEGPFGVKEWDYIFNFRDGNSGGNVVSCQYKVMFDKEAKGRSFHWKPAACASVLKEPLPTTAKLTEVVPAAASRTVSKVTLGANALFAFGRSGLSDISADGRRALGDVSKTLRETRRLESVTVIGHTDRIGSAAYNQRLSEARAESVRNYLVESGVSPALVSARGKGGTNPVVTCDEAGREALVQCLAQNRRVEIVGVAVAAE